MNSIRWTLFLGLLASGMMQFASAGSTGKIYFYGAIVDGGCSFTTGDQKVTSKCDRGGKTVSQVRTLDATQPQAYTLPLSLGQVGTEHIKNDPRLTLMTVTYN